MKVRRIEEIDIALSFIIFFWKGVFREREWRKEEEGRRRGGIRTRGYKYRESWGHNVSRGGIEERERDWLIFRGIEYENPLWGPPHWRDLFYMSSHVSLSRKQSL